MRACILSGSIFLSLLPYTSLRATPVCNDTIYSVLPMTLQPSLTVIVIHSCLCWSRSRRLILIWYIIDHSRDEIYEKNSRIHLDRLKNKFTHCKGIRNNTGSRQTIGIQEELDTTCKRNASWQTTQDNETVFPKWQKESWQTSEETSRYVRPERVNKWPNSMTDIWRWWSITFYYYLI